MFLRLVIERGKTYVLYLLLHRLHILAYVNLFRGATAWHGIESFLKTEGYPFNIMDTVFMVVCGQTLCLSVATFEES